MRLLIILLCICIQGCISFKGTTIPQGASTFFVETPEISIQDAPAEIPQLFMEALRLKIRQQSPLVYDDSEAHLIFYPTITRYGISAVAPQEGDQVAFNRLDVSVSIRFENVLNEEDDFTKSFAAFQDYAASDNFFDREQELIEEILEDITERIFNDTFTDW